MKACTEEEIKEYQEFAALSLQERRRRIFERMIETMPDSPFVHDLLSGRIEIPKKRGRKPRNTAPRRNEVTPRKPKQRRLFI